MLSALLMGYHATAASIVKDAQDIVKNAQSLTVTLFKTTEEFPRSATTHFWFRKGGYFRADHGTTIDVSRPGRAWTYRSDKRIYQKRAPIPADCDRLPLFEMDFFGTGWPLIGEPSAMEWHKRRVLRIEMDGRRLTKETKLYLFVDPSSHCPIGVSANLGSVTQVSIWEDFRVNTKLPDSLFHFTPPAGWKEVTAESGGWKD